MKIFYLERSPLPGRKYAVPLEVLPMRAGNKIIVGKFSLQPREVCTWLLKKQGIPSHERKRILDAAKEHPVTLEQIT